MSNFKKEFETKIRKVLKDKLGYKSVMAVPKVEKITINTSMRSFLQDKKSLERAMEELTIITGQKPRIAAARTSIATFKLREGDKIGLSVTLRGKRMYDFLEKLISVVFPRVKDFSGIDLKAFDGRGNISVGFSEQDHPCAGQSRAQHGRAGDSHCRHLCADQRLGLGSISGRGVGSGR